MSQTKADDKADDKKQLDLTEKEPVTTQHKIGSLDYEAVTGWMPIKNELGEVESEIFYVAYLKKGVKDRSKRPLMFSFNGGPGSPSLWLHLGALGPKRVKMQDTGELPPPPYELVDNPHHWLGETDIVFIDPVGTGFSRGRDEEASKKAWGVKGDVESVGEFIRLFLTRHNRFTSPLYLVGESYGTTRAAGLAGYLIQRGVAFAGIVLVSSILSFQTARFVKGNDLPYALFLPTYTATGHFHGKVKGELQDVLAEAREFALGDYWLALAKGAQLVGKEREKIKSKLAKLTGLSKDYLEYCDLRPVIHDFCKELLRDQKRTVGRLDSRIVGRDDAQRGADQRPEHDPSMSIIMAPYTSLFCSYVREELGCETDRQYEIFGGIKTPWDWGSAGEGHPDTSDALRQAMVKNPYMKIYVASGYYDLATPFFATEYTLNHMGVDNDLLENVTVGEYEAGHMMYIEVGSLKKLKKDVAAFVKSSS